jgi:small subunit ribosomal protein S16
MARGQEVRLEMKADRVEHWIGKGAQTSDRVSTLIKEFKKTAA